MYVCMYVYTPPQPSDSESLILMVSYKQRPFRQAQFPQSSEGQRLTELVCMHVHAYICMYNYICIYRYVFVFRWLVDSPMQNLK